ncbi:MAG: hypothetical protein Q7S75_03500 [bacterium]|nr:hypothetical protein [bacterium]
MVLQKAVDNLKIRPKDERKAVAGSIAMLIVAILFVGWVVIFFKRIQSNSQQVESIGNSLKGKFDLSSVTEAQQQIVNSYNNTDNLNVQAGY